MLLETDPLFFSQQEGTAPSGRLAGWEMAELAEELFSTDPSTTNLSPEA